MFYRLISKLLNYPDDHLLAALPELRERLAGDEGIAPPERQGLLGFVEHLGSRGLTELQADYVQTFDMTPEHALHLTHHLFGDDKNRGPALIDLAEYYRAWGLEIAANELPDYLPLILEFADQLTGEESRLFLSQWTRVLKQLADNLAEAQSPYANLVRLVEQRSQLTLAAA